MKKRLIIVDISSFIFRAFYAIRPMSAPDGTPTNAVSGVLSMMIKLVSDYQPTHVFLARDSKEKTFRHELFDQYKANRDEPPEDLKPQFELIQKMTHLMGFPSFQLNGFEADDLIGSACVQWKENFDEIFIASGDKDLMQFVDGPIKMLDTMKDKIYDRAGVKEKMGVGPEQIVDFLSIIGDSSDNIPGMRGIGPKGAQKLLEEYGTLEECIKNKDKMKGKRLINAFENHVDDALLSKDLVQIVTDLDLGFKADDTNFNFHPSDELIDFLKGLGFRRDVTRLEKIRNEIRQSLESDEEGEFGSTGGNSEFQHYLVQTEKEFKDVLKLIEKSSQVACHTEYLGEHIYDFKVLSLTLSFDGKESYYLPFCHYEESFKAKKQKNLSKGQLEIILSGLWGCEEKVLYCEHSKRDFTYYALKGKSINAKICDLTQVHYILSPSGNHTLPNLAEKYLYFALETLDKKNPLYSLEVNRASRIQGEMANCLYQIASQLEAELKEKDLEKVYKEIDGPLIPVLSRMEREGILINLEFFNELDKEYSKKLSGIQTRVLSEIQKVAPIKEDETQINLRSPKQVGHLLFEVMKLPVISKTKTGPSTSSDVLEQLDSKDVGPIPRMILEFRELDKLVSTYVKAIPNLVNPVSKRLHTNFGQHTATTGRLASTHPNLQNIPIRTADGRKIRKGFVAKPGCVLLSADYSQVELRILAHFSEDPTMLKSFQEGVDIHSQTASEVLSKDLDKVESSDRSMAKAVNFGLMYGQSSFGLANQLKISRKEAKAYITKYFERFNQIKSYLDGLKEFAEKNGFSITLFGRKRFLPDIKSNNRTIKAQAERLAINSPIQGTAADIIKKAMLNIQQTLIDKNLNSRMLLQVHDELIFEVPENELDEMKEIVRDGMENVVSLKVPLSVDMRFGVNWFDLK